MCVVVLVVATMRSYPTLWRVCVCGSLTARWTTMGQEKVAGLIIECIQASTHTHTRIDNTLPPSLPSSSLHDDAV